MLERVALHQTRLNTPGLTIDGRGVVVGTHVLVVTSSLDRLVALLAALSDEVLLGRLSEGMVVLELAAKGASKSWALRAPCSVVDLADRVRRVAALVMGHAFVGSGRHFVEHRDASAPFGFDATETQDPGAGLALYHRAYTHAVEIAREIPPERVILALSPRPSEQKARSATRARFVLAEEGPGRALIGYLARSHVDATVTETSTRTALSDQPRRRFLFVVPQPPDRLRSLLRETPGLTCFVPTSAAAAVEEGWVHPVAHEGMPAFAGPKVTLFRGRGEPPVIVEEGLPTVSVTSLVRITTTDLPPERAAPSGAALASVSLRIRVVPAMSDGRDTSAAWVPAGELELLRRLLYAMGRRALEDTEIALTAEGALVRSRSALLLPVGVPLRAIGASVLLPGGFDLLPHVSTHALEAALEVAGGDVVMLRADGTAALFPGDAFVAAERAIVAGPIWAPLTLVRLDPFEIELPEVQLENVDPGIFPLRDLR